MNKPLLFVITLFLAFLTNQKLHSQTTLAPGDIAIIGYNYDASPQEMAIVTLVPISAGTDIRITDYGYDESTGTFGTISVGNTAEGSILWTTASAIPAGTVIKFSISAGPTPVVTGLPGTVSTTGWSNTVPTTCPAPAGGDNWFIFQGSSPTSVTTFVFAFANPFATTHNGFNQPAGQFLVPGSGAPTNGNSYLPPSLTLGTTAIALNRDPASFGYHGDDNVYTGTKSGSKATILAAICNTSNWTTNEITAYDINPGGANFPGTNPIFTLIVPISATQNQTNASCNGICNGSASVSATGGTTPYTYSWLPSGGTGATASSLCAGNYTCIITDALSQTLTKIFTITQPTVINLNAASQTNVSCFGGSNGAASVIAASGGAGGYTYNWTPGNPTGDGTTSVTGLVAGTWTCTVTDANSCTRTQTFNITQPTVINLNAASQTNVSCFGGSNGAASVIAATGGAGGYTYNWTPGNPTGDGTTSVTGLVAGTWTCTVTDANSCTRTQTFNITQPSAIILNAAVQTNVACNGGSTGAASVNAATGGAGGYTYNWTPGNPTGDGTTSVTGLVAGTWTCTVTDANSCTRTQTFNVTQPTAINLNAASQTNIACNGGSNGAASINAPTGGAGGYTYNWTPGNPTGDGTTSVTGLVAGTWTCTVTDANSCVATQTFNVTQPTALVATASAQTNISCNGGSNGAASVNTPTGGAGGYTYNWTPGNPTGDGTTSVTGLTAGTWSCSVTDANSCVATQTFNVTQPTAFNLNVTGTSTICQGANTTLIANATGGTGSLSYIWNPGSLAGTTQTVTPSNNQIYTVTVSDANNCTTSNQATITVNALPTLTVNSGAVCNGQSFTITASGANTFTYTGGSAIVTPTANATYNVYGTDANGCNNYATSSVTVNALPTVTVNNIEMCLNQTMVLFPSGLSAYTITPGNSNYVSPTANTTYTVEGTDINGCFGSAVSSVTVNTLPIVMASTSNTLLCVGQTATLTAMGANTYVWNTTETTMDIAVSPTATMVYTVTGTDVNGCMNVGTVQQDVSTCTDIINSISGTLSGVEVYPNPNSGAFIIEVSTITTIELMDVLGKTIIKQQLEVGKHDVNISYLADGVYFLKTNTKTIRVVKH